jgi:hypothetical protein
MVGVGLPNLLSFGGTLKLTRFFGAGLNIGLIPTMQISVYGKATLSYQEFDLYGRIYPFGGSLFLGAGAGYATVSGVLASHIAAMGYSGDYRGEGSVRTLVLTPQIGFLKTLGAGFSIGMAFGAQVPIAPSQIEFQSQFDTQGPQMLPASLAAEYLAPRDQQVRDTLDKIGRTPLPTVSLHLGWLL